MPPLTVLPAVKADIPALARLTHAAFTDPSTADRLSFAMHPRTPLEVQLQESEKGFAASWEKPGRRHFKVVDAESGEIIGFSKWYFPYTLTAEEAAAGVGEDRVPQAWMEGSEEKLCEEFWGRLYQARRESMNHEKDYFVDILVISPSHQRKGIGKFMLEDGLKKVDADKARCYIEATVEGHGLYEKLGWKHIGGMTLDLSEWGLGSASRTYLMREPQLVEAMSG